MLLLWAVTGASAAISVDRRLWPTVVASLAAFLVASRWPELRFLMVSAASFVAAVTFAWAWRPSTLFERTPEEIERYEKAAPPRSL